MTIDKRRRHHISAHPEEARSAVSKDLRFTPVPRHYNRHDGWTPERQQRFIEALADTGSVKAAAHAVNMTPEGAYQLRRHPDAGSFRKAWEAALALGVQQLEDMAMHRALHGVEVPVYSYGKLIGTRTVYNDRLTMFILRNRAPTRFAADGRVTARRSSLGDPQEANRLSRLKKQWRKEWEEELAAREKQSADEVCESINKRLETMRRRMIASMSQRTRDLWDAYQQSAAQDREDERNAWHREIEDEEWNEAEDCLWEQCEEGKATEPREPGEPRDMPRFLTHGDGELGLPRGSG